MDKIVLLILTGMGCVAFYALGGILVPDPLMRLVIVAGVEYKASSYKTRRKSLFSFLF
ncbi:MAG: hypothetical protein OK452_01410 [Thaumarchaeota archaeon]|nr:hypothetical protein [Nitrososphaerota archaeon]